MTALGWSIQKHDKLVIVNGVGVFDLPFFLAYLQAMEEADAIGYCFHRKAHTTAERDAAGSRCHPRGQEPAAADARHGDPSEATRRHLAALPPFHRRTRSKALARRGVDLKPYCGSIPRLLITSRETGPSSASTCRK